MAVVYLRISENGSDEIGISQEIRVAWNGKQWECRNPIGQVGFEWVGKGDRKTGAILDWLRERLAVSDEFDDEEKHG